MSHFHRDHRWRDFSLPHAAFIRQIDAFFLCFFVKRRIKIQLSLTHRRALAFGDLNGSPFPRRSSKRNADS